MKKSTLALSIAAAIGGFGLAGNALAVTDFVPGNDAGSSSATTMTLNQDGIGHALVFPYFTAQGDNATLLTITNTDTTNGKLVKVRFRGAANSDDLYDFQIAMSPGDVWTAAVTKNATTGGAQLTSTDKSCTVPSTAYNGNFGTGRVDGGAVAQTLEGYVEVLAMADIKDRTATVGVTTGLFTAIKHKSGVAPCTAAVLTDKLSADDTYANLTSDAGAQLSNPTTGLTGDWIIMNQKSVASWSGSATALQANGAAKLTFWPQTNGTPKAGATPTAVTAGTSTMAAAGNTIKNVTSDPLLASGIVPILNVDLPDLSTPTIASTDATTYVDGITAQLAVKSIANQYVTTAGIAAVTDILFAQPTRRYHVAVNYTASSVADTVVGDVKKLPLSTKGTTATAIFRNFDLSTAATVNTVSTTVGSAGGAGGTGTAGSAYYVGTASASGSTPVYAANVAIPTGGRNVCLNSIKTPTTNTIFDREETTPTAATAASPAFIVSPAVVAASTSSTFYVCGEAAVVSLNNGGAVGSSALGASIARTDISSTTLAAYNEGWVYFATPAANAANGLPILGASFIRASNNATNYGFSYANKVTR